MEESLRLRFTSLLEDNRQRILRISRVYARNAEDQKDLFQEVALNIWKSLHSFRHEASTDTWVYRICLNVCMQHALKVNKAKGKQVQLDGLIIKDDSANIQENMERSEKTKKLYQCISELNESEKSLIVLFLEDLPYIAIAEITGISENHVAVKIGRIKKKLFNCFNI